MNTQLQTKLHQPCRICDVAGYVNTIITIQPPERLSIVEYCHNCDGDKVTRPPVDWIHVDGKVLNVL